MSAFGVTHVISKGSPRLGLRLIDTYGRKPSRTVEGVRASMVGRQPVKGTIPAQRGAGKRVPAS